MKHGLNGKKKMIIKGNDIDEVLYKTSKELIKAPVYSPRGQKTKELIKPQLVIENPELCVITNKGRKFSLDYLNAEINWYLSGEKSIKKIKEYASMWENIANKKGEINSNYGEIVWKQQLDNFKGNQYNWVIEQLTKDKDSRQAIINFNQPKHKSNTKDFVCTTSTQYLIRNNKLLSFTDMRSNDLIYGFCYDFPFFSYLQNKIHKKLKQKYSNLEIGKNIHSATSLHVYEKHFKLLENIINQYDNKKSNKFIFNKNAK